MGKGFFKGRATEGPSHNEYRQALYALQTAQVATSVYAGMGADSADTGYEKVTRSSC